MCGLRRLQGGWRGRRENIKTESIRGEEETRKASSHTFFLTLSTCRILDQLQMTRCKLETNGGEMPLEPLQVV